MRGERNWECAKIIESLFGAVAEGVKETIVEQEESRNSQVFSEETRLGELDSDTFMCIVNCMKCMLNWMHVLYFICDFRVSGKFQETAWRAIHSRQATHAFIVVSGFLREEPPGGTSIAARKNMLLTQFFGFWLNCLAVTNTRQATRATFDSILSFYLFWGIFNRW